MKRIYILIVLCILSEWVKGQVSGNQNYIYTQTYITSDKQKSLEQIVYYDGLGRPVETVDKGVTPDSKDLVSLQEYDQFGRDSYSWLPAKSSGNGGYVDVASVKSGARQLSGGDTRPYTMLVYETSPLKRVTEQYGPGQAWEDKPVQTVLKTNFLGSEQNYAGPLSCISFVLDPTISAIIYEYSAAVSGVKVLFQEYSKSCAVTGVPFDQVEFFLNLKVQVNPSSEVSQLSATPG